eukprot:4967469-Pleurochrysis_carterae.AAC.1
MRPLCEGLRTLQHQSINTSARGKDSCRAAVATPALHHRNFLRLHVQKCSPPEHWLAWKQTEPPPPFRQGRQEGQSNGASTGQGA